MAGQVLYRKWRPQRFEEVIGQEHVSRTLQRALASGRIAHAYLFTGPRGTGKTSTARILAKAVNCTGGDNPPCNHCPPCLAINEGRAVDLIEIDAASNRGIDEIRDLRERVKFAPAEMEYKIYVIDEAHMLTTEAFNALLKTLEEPPPHVIFILATTEVQKIPATVLSRCQRFDFRRVRVEDTVKRLEAIVQSEGLQATRPALELIARQSTGSMRDAESLLDQLMVYAREGTLDVPEVQSLLGTRGTEQVGKLVDAMIDADLPTGLRLIQQLVDEGVDLRQFNRDLVAYLRGLLFLAVTRDGADLLDTTREVLEEMRARAQRTTGPRLAAWVRRFSLLDTELRTGWYSQLPLEMALVEALLPGETLAPPAVSAKPAARPAPERQKVTEPAAQREAPPPSGATAAAPVEPPARVAEKPAPAKTPARAAQPPAEQAPAQVEEETAPAAAGSEEITLETVQDFWEKIVDSVRPLDPMVQALLHGSYCQPVAVEGRIIVLGFRYAFHKAKIEEVRNRRIVEQVISKVLNANLGVRCILDEGASAAPNKRRQALDRQQAQQDPRVKAAANIFNARIVDVQTGSDEE